VTKADRAAVRTKLATSAEEWIRKAHPQGSKKVENIPASGDLAVVETATDAQAKDLANLRQQAKVRKQAEALRELIASGQITTEQFPALVAQGAVDRDAVAYYKKMWDLDAESKSYAIDLTKEQYEAKKKAEMDMFTARYKRAYALAQDKADRGYCGTSQADISAEADKLMEYDDNALMEIKKIVAQAPSTSALTKQASARFPQVGVASDSSYSQVSTQPQTLEEQMTNALRGVRRR
jgi:hypothetical protein